MFAKELSSGVDVGGKVLGGERGPGRDEIGGGAFEDDFAAVVTGARAEIDDPVSVGHHGLVVGDDNRRFAGIDEPIKEAEQVFDIGEVESSGRFIEHVDASLFAYVGREFESLAFTAGEGGEGLTEADVAEADIGETGEDCGRGRQLRFTGAEEFASLGDRHREHFADVLAAEFVGEDFGLETLAVALVADRFDAGHHREIGVDHPGAVAIRAGALGVGAEEGGFDSVGFSECLADRFEQIGVGGGVAAARTLDRGLIDRDYAIAL